MKVAIVGSGRVGLVTGVCLAEWGFEVHAVDRDREKVERLRDGECPVDENGLPEMLQRNLGTGRLEFSTWPEAKTGLRGARIVFLCVDTPSGGDDEGADLSRLFAATESAAVDDVAGLEAEWSMPSVTPTSAALARDLKRRGWSFVGPTTVYAFMQSVGLVNDHVPGCFARAECQAERSALSIPRPPG